MRLTSFFSKRKTSRARRSRIETLESRDLLSLSVSSADYKALVAAKSFGDDSAIWVTSLADTVSSSDGKITLREALDYAGQSLKAGVVSSTIRFEIGGSIALSSSNQSLKVLSKSVTIDASDVGGIEIKATKSLAMYVFGGASNNPINVELVDVSIVGGATTQSKGAGIQLSTNCNLSTHRCSFSNAQANAGLGAAVYASSGTLSFVETSFSNNASTGSTSKAGAVYLESGSLSAINCAFVGNTAAEGGAIYVKTGDVSLVGSLFDGNAATQGNGGAVYANVDVEIDACGFRYNSSAASGGAIYVDGENESVLTDVTFLENKAVEGGAISAQGQALSVSSSRFVENAAAANGGAISVGLNASFLANDAIFEANAATANGGAINNLGSLVMTRGRFSENEANDGGALYSVGYFEIRNSDFEANNAQRNGGAIYYVGDRASWLLKSCVENSAAVEGGAIYANGSLVVVDSTLEGNSATSSGGAISNLGRALIAQSKFIDNAALGATGEGGAVLNYANATLTVSDVSFIGNEATFSGGALANFGEANVAGSTIASNAAGLYGGGVYNAGRLTAQFSSFYENAAESGGGFADAYSSASNVLYSTLWGNVASNLGGGFYSYGAATLQNAVIERNVASSAQSAGYYGAPDASSAPNVDSSSTVRYNVAASELDAFETTDALIVVDVETGERLNASIFSFGNFAVGEEAKSKRFAIVNLGAKSVSLRDITTLYNFESDVCEWKLANAFGDSISVENATTLDVGESIFLDVKFTPTKLGAKNLSISWIVDELDDSGAVVPNSERSFDFACVAEISRAAAASTNVVALSSSPDFDISIKESGTFTISLAKAPSQNVVLYLQNANDAVLLSTDVLLFTPDNYSTPQQVVVTIDESRLTDVIRFEQIFITPTLLVNDSNFNGAAFADVALNVEGYVVFQDDVAVDVGKLAPSGTTRWDFNNDGRIDATTYGSSYWIDASQISGDVVTYSRTRNGATTTTTLDVAYVASPKTAVAETTTFVATPGLVSLALKSESSAIARWRVDWGDGAPYSEFNALSTEASFAHNYKKDGVYALRVELVDVDGNGEGTWTMIELRSIEGVDASSAVAEFKSDEFLEYFCDAELDLVAEFFQEGSDSE